MEAITGIVPSRAERVEQLGVDIGDLADEAQVDLAAVLARQTQRLGRQHATAERVQAHGLAAQLIENPADRLVDRPHEHVLDDVEGRALVGIAPAFGPRPAARPASFIARVMALPPPWTMIGRMPDRGHESHVRQQVPLGGLVIEHAAAEFEDDDPVAKRADIAHRFDQSIRFCNSFLHENSSLDSQKKQTFKPIIGAGRCQEPT